MDVFELAGVVPAPGCPHYITAAAADRGAITCTACNTPPPPWRVRTRSRRPLKAVPRDIPQDAA